MMVLNESNYYSLEADREYCSASQYKSFIGVPGIPGCEEQAVARLRGDYVMKPTKPMLIGSAVDALWGNEFDKFVSEHPECVSTKGPSKGQLKAEYQQAQKMYERGKRDPLFNAFMSGEYQRIFTGEIAGLPFKCKLDSYIPGKAIVDLKTTQDIHKRFYVPDVGSLSFIEYFGYDIQGAIYQSIVEQETGEKLRFIICAVDKAEEPDISIIEIPQKRLDDCLEEVKQNAWKIEALKSGEMKTIRCEQCEWCRRTKVLDHVIGMDELGLDVR